MSALANDVAGSRSASPLGYMPALDGLRAFAVILVLIYHAAQPVKMGGNVGVDVFFVLSGYLITSILCREIDKHGRIRFARFYVRRAIRLYPPLILAAVVVSAFAVFLAPSLPKYAGETVAALLYLTPLAPFVIGDSAVWYHTWTLALEEWYYLAWPAALTVMVLMRLKWRTIAAVMATSGFLLLFAKLALHSAGFGFGAYLRIGGIFVGSALALYLHAHTVRPWMLRLMLPGLVIAASAVVYAPFGIWESVAYIAVVIGTTMMIPGLAIGGNRIARFLAARPFVYIGTISYEIYLWHAAVFTLGGWATGGRPIETWWWAVPLSLVLAAVSHRALAPLSERARLAFDALVKTAAPTARAA